jgi:hypothetical protein
MKSLPLAVAATGTTLALFFGAPIAALAAGSGHGSATVSNQELPGRPIGRPTPDSGSTETEPRRPVPHNLIDGNVEDRNADVVVPTAGVLSNCDGVMEVPATPPPQYRVSASSPFSAGCDGVAATGTSFINSEVEPSVAINPLDSNNLIGVWQQDRWSDGGSHGIMTGVSNDGGVTWSLLPMPFSRCGGGNSGNGGDYARATDPWVTFSPNGTAHQFALAFSGATFQPGSASAMLVSRSINGGTAWSNPTTLKIDGEFYFNDKNSITADPTNSNFVYAVWDRLVSTGGGPAYFSRTLNGGANWEAAHPIYDPGPSSQTIGNVIAVRAADDLVLDLFTELDEAADHSTSGFIAVIRSTNKGLTWSAPIRIADLLAIGVSDPETGTLIRDGSLIPQIAIAPDGTIYVVWQDSRFSGGVRDGIALSRSSNGGLTWSAPVRINRKLSVQAFMPNVLVRADGTIGVTYFDLSSNTPDASTLLTDYWIAQSTDGVLWRWNRISPAFDLDMAPNAEGLFVGDYQGLISRGGQFLPFFVRTNAGDVANRTDLFSAPTVSAAPSAPAATDLAESLRIATEQPPPISATLRKRVHENIVRNAEGLPGWRNGVRRRPGPPPRNVDRHWAGPR